MTATHRRAGLVAAAAALTLTAGCTATASKATAPSEPVIGRPPALLAGFGLRLPIEDFMPTTGQDLQSGKARLRLVAHCLSRFGISYPATQPDTTAYGPRSLTDRRYGITDAALARTSGYGLGTRDPRLMPKPKRPDIGPDGQNALSGQGRSVVRGIAVPTGGCLGEANRTLQQGVPAGVNLRAGERLAQRTFEQSRRDSRVTDATRVWSGCMRAAGYAYADPLAAAADPAFADVSSAAQIAVATTDIACKATSNLVGVWFTVESAYQQQEIAAERAALDATLRGLQAYDRAAEAALG